jgi:hypothetical protein
LPPFSLKSDPQPRKRVGARNVSGGKYGSFCRILQAR